jgi:peptide/nickel transport system substrate-binding protein
MFRNKKYSVLLVLMLALALLVSGCGTAAKVAGADQTAKEGGTLTFGLTGDITALDPAFAYDYTTNPVVNQITEGLLKFNDKQELVSGLAESWENTDPKTYIFHLRKDVKFQDGTPMTIEDVLFSLERIKDPKTASYLGWMFGSVDKFEKVDDSTLKITLTQPDAQFKFALATSAGHVISKAYYDAHKDNFGKPDGGLLGTGPFKFVSWKTGTEIVLEKNKDYWDKKSGGPYLDKIVYKIIPEGTTRVTGLKTNQINLTIGLPLDLVSVVEGMSNVNVQKSESYSIDWIAFNTAKKPFDDVNVRKALYYALDRKKLMDEVIKDTGEPSVTIPAGPDFWTYARDKWEAYAKEVPDYAFSIDKAKEFLAKSSVPSGFNAKITTDNDPQRMSTALAWQEAVKPLGINLEIEKISEEELTTQQFAGDRKYDIILGRWGSDFPDPSGNIVPIFNSANVGDGGSNFANYKNSDVDALLNEQATLTDDSKRAELLINALKKTSEDVPLIVVDYPKTMLAADKSLTGYSISPIWYWNFFVKDIYFTK